MKSFAILAAAAGAVLAQDIPMPTGECANLCINNMAQIAESDFQCDSDDIACFCTRSNWAFGIRDCTREACDDQQSASAIEWAYARCVGVAATASDTPDALPILTSAAASASAVSPSSTGDDNDDSNSITSSIADSASSVTSSLGSMITSAASSAASGASSVTSSLGEGASSALSSLQSEASDIISSVESAVSSATDSDAEETGDATATESGAEETGDATSAEDEGAAPRVTGMSFAAGAGIAAWLLL